jgi:hypothetical protein
MSRPSAKLMVRTAGWMARAYFEEALNQAEEALDPEKQGLRVVAPVECELRNRVRARTGCFKSLLELCEPNHSIA